MLGQVIGSFGQAVIATTHKVLIVKTGLMAGQTFGGKATSFDYRNIMGVEIRTGFATGEFEIIVGGLATPAGKRNGNKVKASEAPNAISFGSVDQKYFQMMAAQIRMMAARPLNPTPQPQNISTQRPNTPPQSPTVPSNGGSGQLSIPEQIRQLAELHAAGILTDAEFSGKKAELLSRM